MKNPFSTLFTFLGKANSEDNGRPSSMRTNVFFANIQWVTAITFGFIWVVVYKPELILAYLTVLSGLVIATLGLKLYQKTKEAPGENTNETNS